MLSRIAESLYWIGRYLERADAKARVLDVHLTRIQDEPGTDQERQLRTLLGAMGVDHGDGAVTPSSVVDMLAFDATSPASITAALTAARENARGAREILSSELWEALNVTWHGLAERRMAAVVLGPQVFCHYVRERTAMTTGLISTTMVRDDGWRFLSLGVALERIDMAARMLSTPALAEGRPSVLAGLLRSVGGHDTFVRVYQGAVSPANVAEFLLRDQLSPRSVAFSLATAESLLRELDPGLDDRLGVADGARRALGRMRLALEFRSSAELLDDLPSLIESLLRLTSRTSDEVTSRYFGKSLLVRWAEEVAL
ncbi:alpha-E domain-containing protein [Jiangella mangrovi]|uniref:Putative alpha-E superfamily protein n=1 Tax=Jiangella mangrovi TaxID=1524084 RepID=A0A7W9GRE5_9ACTN|nr:alpha-E domain-containing protein [Jiangella mangrovi]MBB5788645.1 putative alpha-E superfamily protein [Jiangella mangrovi]